VVLAGGTVWTGTGERWTPGWVRWADGRLVDLGPGEPTLREGETVLDVTGRHVTPGIIDTHSHLGVYPSPGYRPHSDGNEATAPITAQVRAMDSVWPQDPGFERALAGGVTSMLILPGSANLIGGRGFTVKLHRGARSARDMHFPGAPETLKMACGENPKRVYGDRGGPSTRMGGMSVVRQAFVDARRALDDRARWRQAHDAWCAQGGPAASRPAEPPRSLLQETLMGVMEGSILPQIHCYRADEMLQQIELADEFGYRIRSFHHAVEAYKIRDVLAQREISVSTWADWWGFKLEAYDAIMENAGLLHERGARAVIHSDSPIGIQRLNQEASKAMWTAAHAGVEVDEEAALQWITANAAWTLGIEHLTGTLQPGLAADVVVWSHHPLSVYAQADLVWVDGALEWDRSNPPPSWSDFEAGQWPMETGVWR
jgi:imidazolonepropionase-like amidohydrolase